ncbi:hypothetical protein [Leptolyngbya sp. Heron Island J]|uniref:hypothetical protein n=1 Tax=Leptolyngbya sp. Heron Island J TaxID=1385935 RepID=UPI000421F52C|nr:hypothetical protein [Leptolyngbya sp. Heron Island J]
MFQEPTQDASASNFLRRPEPLSEHAYEPVRHIVLGSLTAVRDTIKLLHKLNYAEPNDWSKPLPTGRPNEVMAILTKKVRVD